MPYKLKRGESVPDGIRRVVTEELEAVIEQLLRASERNRDTAVHEARKSVKKVRGALRLVRPQIGRVYRKENARLREAARGLSDLRDGGAIVDSFDGIVEKYRQELRDGLRPIRTGLLRSKREREKELRPERVIKDSARKLEACLERVPDWPMKEDGYSAVGPGLKASYRAGRRAMANAIDRGSAEDFHLWRRRAKDHWYHVRLLEHLWTGEMKAREDEVHELETALGDDHNLLVLCGQLSDAPDAFGGAKNVDVFTALAQREQKDLREKAIAIGKRLYVERPPDFESRFAQLWHAWQGTGKV